MKKSNKNSKAILLSFQPNDNKAINAQELENIKSQYAGESQIFDLKKLSYSNGLSDKPEARILILRNFYSSCFSEMENLERGKKTESVFSSASLKSGQSISIEAAIKALTNSTAEFKSHGIFYNASRKNEIKNNQSNYLFHINENNVENHLIFDWYIYGIMTAREITIPVFSGDLCIMCDGAKKYKTESYELRYFFHN